MIQTQIFNRMRNDEVNNFAESLSTILKGADFEKMDLTSFETEVSNAHTLMSKAMAPVRRSINTPDIIAASEDRGEAYLSLNAYIGACLKRKNDEWRRAAYKVNSFIDAHGNGVLAGGYSRVSNKITLLIDRMRTDTECWAAVGTLMAEAWVAELELANNKLKALFLERIAEMRTPVEKVDSEEGREAIFTAIKRLERYLLFNTEFSEDRSFKELYSVADKLAKTISTTVRHRWDSTDDTATNTELVENDTALVNSSV